MTIVVPATTAGFGVQSPANGSSEKPSPPTGRRTESAGSESAQPGNRAKKRTPRAKRRTQALIDFDRGLGSRLVAGADEAGRGCLAGPLVSAAVLLDYGSLSLSDRRCLTGLDDSKRLTREERDRLFREIIRIATRVSVVTRCAAGIDRRGLHRTNIEALAKALERLRPEGAVCLVDGFNLPVCVVEHQRVVKGDATSAAIAAASVVAKVTRDRQMERLDREHPHWGFAEHVGYATPAHHEAIRAHGPSPIHRLSFASAAYA